MRPYQVERFRFLVCGILLSAWFVGCGPGGNSSKTRDYASMTSGSPEARWAYLGQLTQAYTQEDPSDPASSRKLLDRYTRALTETTKSIVDDRATPAELREQAMGAYLTALGRRKEVDPAAIDKLIAETFRIENENPKTRIAVIAAFERARIHRESAIAATDANVSERIRKWGEEVLHIGQMTPAPPVVPQTLDELGQKTEFFGHTDLAEKLYRTLVERFPKDENVKFANGALYRLGLKGKPLEDLEGTGRDGKPLSIKDFRGKVVLIDFWATGCKPCVAEIPALEELRKSLAPRGMALLSVALDPEGGEVDRFMEYAKIDWPVILSQVNQNNMESAITLRYGIKGIPFKMVVDREGNLAASGYRLEDVLPTLDRLLLVPEIPGMNKPVGEPPKAALPAPLIEPPK